MPDQGASSSAMPADLIKVGQLRAAYGIQGWLWVYSDTDPMFNLFEYQPWWIRTATGWQTLKIRRWRTQGKGLVVRLEGIEERTQAERYTGVDLYVSKSVLPPAGQDEYYWADLLGLSVYGRADATGSRPLLGVVKELFETGANDVIVVVPCADSVDQEERWLPWHAQVVEQVDLQARTLQVDWAIDD